MCEHDCGLREAGAHARDDTDTLTYRAYSRWRLRAAAASRRSERVCVSSPIEPGGHGPRNLDESVVFIRFRFMNPGPGEIQIHDSERARDSCGIQGFMTLPALIERNACCVFRRVE